MSSDKAKILITAADIAQEAQALLSQYELIYTGRDTNFDHIAELIQEHQPVAIIVRYSGVNEKAMSLATKLRVISKHGSGIDSIDQVAAKKHGIKVVAASGVNANAVAEHAISLMLATSKSIVALNSRMQDGYWDKPTHQSLELKGKTLGLVGLGAIGNRVAELATAFQMNVMAYDPALTSNKSPWRLVELNDIWTQADIISLHCPLLPSTKHLINRNTIAKMKKGVIIVNTSRGAVINEHDAIEAIKNGHIAALGLDTFEIEPLPNTHILRGFDNVILSPHVGGVTKEAYVGMGVAAAQNLLDVLHS